MSELEEKLNALMSNPQLMQQIAAMAQNFGSGAAESPVQEVPAPEMPGINPQQIQAMFQALSQNNMDKEQQALLHALTPYLSAARIHKLKRAMQASKMAGAASLFLNSGGLHLLSGR